MTTTTQASPQQIQDAQERLDNAQAAFVDASDATVGERRILIQNIRDAKQALDKLTVKN